MNIDPSKVKIAEKPPEVKPMPKGLADPDGIVTAFKMNPDIREKVRLFAISHSIGASEALGLLLANAFEHIHEVNQAILHRENVALKMVRGQVDERALQYLIQSGKLEVHKYGGEDFVNRAEFEKMKRKLEAL